MPSRILRGHRVQTTLPFAVLGLITVLSLLSRTPFLWRVLDYDELCRVNPISTTGLLDAITSQQRASISLGFAVLIKLFIWALGNTEISVRLLPFLAGLALPLLGYGILRNLNCSQFLALVGATVLAFSPVYNLHAVELKPYTVEAIFALGLCWMLLTTMKKLTTPKLLCFCLLCAIGLLVASPTAWLLPGVIVAVGLGLKQQDGQKPVATSLIVTAALLTTAFAHYHFVLKLQVGAHLYNQMLVNAPREYSLSALLRFTWVHLLDLFSVAFGVPQGWLLRDLTCAILVLLFCVGVVTLVKRGRGEAALYCTMAILTTLAASLAKIWPFGAARPNFFLLPLLVLVVLVGLGACQEVFASRKRRLIEGLLFVAIFSSIVPFKKLTDFYVDHVPPREPFLSEIKQATTVVMSEARDGDLVLSFHRNVNAGLRYYLKYHVQSHGWNQNQVAIVEMDDEILEDKIKSALDEAIAEKYPQGRIFLVLYHPFSAGFYQGLTLLDTSFGEPTELFSKNALVVFLYAEHKEK